MGVQMNKLLPFLVVSLFFLSLIPIGSCDVTVYTGQYFYVGNETYGVTQTMIFQYIESNSNWIKFNNTDFNVTSANSININLSFLHENYSNASNGDEVFDANIDVGSGNVYFNLSGFPTTEHYTIKKASAYYACSSANSDGNISFTNNVWGGTVHLEIFENMPPVAVDDAFSVKEAKILTSSALSGVLANDNDPDGGPLTVVLATDVSNGNLSLSSDGSFVYKAPVDFSGVTTFTYYANDSMENSSIATATIHVSPASGVIPDDNIMECYQRVWTKDDMGQIVVVYSGERIKRITGYDSIIVVGIDDISKFEDFLGIGNLIE